MKSEFKILRKTKQEPTSESSLINPLPPFVSGLLPNGKKWTTPKDLQKEADFEQTSNIKNTNNSDDCIEVSSERIIPRIRFQIPSSYKKTSPQNIDEISDNSSSSSNSEGLDTSSERIIPRIRFQIPSAYKEKYLQTNTELSDTTPSTIDLQATQPKRKSKLTREWKPLSEEIFPVRDVDNPLQVLPFLADRNNPECFSDDIHVIFEYFATIPRDAIDRLQKTSAYKKKSSNYIEKKINLHIENTVSRLINSPQYNENYFVDTVSENAEKDLQGQKGLFVKKNSIKLGEIICPFAGTYSDKDADFQKEQYYSFATSMENCVISPSASQQAGFSANTALKLTQDGDIYYNKDGYPEYDTNHINAYFIEKYATFKNENDEKKIIPLIFILYVGSDKVHKKDGDIEIRVNYGPDYLKSMANKTNTQRPHKKQKLDTTILSSHIGFSDKITPKKQKTTTLMKKTWEENFANLSEYKNKHNRFRDLSKTDQNLYRFYLSSIKQLQKYSSGENVELKEDQINKLKGIGLNEEQILKTKTWEERFASLAKYKKDNDGFQGLRRIDKNLYEFYRISIKILEKHDNNESVTLTLDQINKLKGIGINKEQILKTKTWEENFAYLSEYKRKHNGFKDLLKIRDLYYFFLKNKRLLDQHTAGQGVKLTQKQIDKLKEIGLDKIEIKSPKKTWEENFAYLSEYKRKHNGFKDLRKTDQNLYSFYKNSIKLLQKYNSGVKVELKEDQIDKLKEIGLDKIKLMEKQKSRTWEESFASLIEYKKKHNGFQGLSNIDKRLYDFYSKHKKLLNEHNNGEKVKLTPDQIKKLQELFLGDSS